VLFVIYRSWRVPVLQFDVIDETLIGLITSHTDVTVSVVASWTSHLTLHTWKSRIVDSAVVLLFQSR